jgi:hypothetical protein
LYSYTRSNRGRSRWYRCIIFKISVASGGTSHGQREQEEQVLQYFVKCFCIYYYSSATATASATHFAVFDASATGNLLFYGQLTTAKTIADGDEVKFNASALTLTVA